MPSPPSHAQTSTDSKQVDVDVNIDMDVEVEVRKYSLPPTQLVPNSPLPLLHYPGYLLRSLNSSSSSSSPNTAVQSTDVDTDLSPNTKLATNLALHAFNTLSANGWETQWIYRYGPTQVSHYHSFVHECMVVLSGTARVRFGVADSERSERNEYGDESSNGIVLDANPGDVFILPAGTAHKTHDVSAGSTFALLTPGNGYGIISSTPSSAGKAGAASGSGPEEEEGVERASAEEARQILRKIELDGFTMLGAYPIGRAAEWDFATGGEHTGHFERVWDTPAPDLDPMLGKSVLGICQSWKTSV